jgi:hypothetical protein
MSLDNERHLDEREIIISVVDETDLPEFLRRHLLICPQCGNEKIKIEQALIRLEEAVKSFAPMPKKHPRLYPDKSKRFVWRPTPVLAMAFMFVIVIAAVWWADISNKPDKSTTLTDATAHVWEDEELFTEITSLSENALPETYNQIVTEPDPDIDEEFYQYVAPAEDPQPTSDVHNKEKVFYAEQVFYDHFGKLCISIKIKEDFLC